MKQDGKRRWDGPASERKKEIAGPVQEPEQTLRVHIIVFCLLSRVMVGAKMTRDLWRLRPKEGRKHSNKNI